MGKGFKRLCAWLLILAVAASLLPVRQEAQAAELTQDAYAQADALFDRIEALETRAATRSITQTQLTDAAQALVLSAEDYVEGSLVRSGDSFTWWTEGGIRCLYSPRMRRISEELTPATGQDVIANEPTATGNQVYVIGPYYGYDDSFTDQYKNEARRIAAAIGDTDGYTLYSGKSATVDKVAEAVSNGAVVFFDSHGLTDYERGYDYVSGATNSYLCLSSSTGLTQEDFADGAMYFSDGVCVNGAAIANHMEKDSPGGFLWMALCLGMATNTLCDPLRQRGVEVVYGYSQSVTFAGDYLYEETFWDEMTQGNTVAGSIATMKEKWGEWDWSVEMASYYGYYDGYETIEEARYDYVAFPVVVSDADPHPGQRYKDTYYGACSLQEVKSAYRLSLVDEPAELTLTYVDTPVSGTAYKLVMDQAKLGKQLGFTGEMNSYYYATTAAIEEMADVYLEEAAGGYRMYFLDGADKTYLNVIPRDNDSTRTNVVLQTLAENPSPSIYELNTRFRYVKTTAVGTDWYLGTYGTHLNISASNTSYIADTDTIGVSQFTCWFATVGTETEVPGEPDVPEITVTPGDLDGVEGVNEDDAIYLLRYVLMPEMFPVQQPVDYDKSGTVNEDDAIYLLRHVLMPDTFPLEAT